MREWVYYHQLQNTAPITVCLLWRVRVNHAGSIICNDIINFTINMFCSFSKSHGIIEDSNRFCLKGPHPYLKLLKAKIECFHWELKQPKVINIL